MWKNENTKWKGAGGNAQNKASTSSYVFQGLFFNKTIKKTVELCSFLEASFHLRWRRKMKHHELNSVMINIKIKKSVSFHTS